MRTLPFLGVLALAVALGACGGDDEAGPTAAPSRATSTSAAQPSGPVEAVLAGHSLTTGAEIFFADPLTLEPADGRTVELPFFPGPGARSPDGATLAVGGSEGGAVALVDLDRMRSLGTVDAAPASYVDRLHWAREDLLLASLGGREAQAVAIDPATREVLFAQALGGTLLSSAAAGSDLVFLLAPTSGIGPARVAVFDGEEVRTTTLDGVPRGLGPGRGL